jgi:RHH-type proline utilization regulon transcriptional repressor/proline dehydrogenase/delta 1-pyrroline-5-carboxylate dehydrogenase
MDLDHARTAIRQANFASEKSVVREMIAATGLTAAARARIARQAEAMVDRLRADPSPSLMASFLAEYGLSTDEGVALMCLAEAYLRVPDAPTLDALIRDKIGGADWSRHTGEAGSFLVNASTWALMLTGSIFRDGAITEAELVGNLRNLIQRVGEPFVRTAVAQAMRVLGQQFVLGRTIEDAIRRAAGERKAGYRFSFDMLGEAAMTEADARRYFLAYAKAIAAIAGHAGEDGVHDNPGISVKLSALHPRYEFSQRRRVMDELVPRLAALAEMARSANIGFSVDAEEADRLDLSLDVIEAVAGNADLAGWDGFGMVVQTYAKQSLPVLEWIAALAEKRDRRFAVRLVKGAYWDMEIKHAQVLGLPAYPAFTRKSSTDAAYLAGARFLFDNADRLYPQFATHNAHTACAVADMAGDVTGFEFQRLHGMGEALHARLRETAGRHVRIYAPVGIHEDLLAYLVRRLLENGANSSFVHQLLDKSVPAGDLVRDPVAATLAATPVAHPHIPLPPDLFAPERRNSRGWNINDPLDAAAIEVGMTPFRSATWTAAPVIAGKAGRGRKRQIANPADLGDEVGTVFEADGNDADRAMMAAVKAFAAWRDRDVEDRATMLERIADLYEEHTFELMALLTREAGKTRLDGVLEIREAVDFCRYYAGQTRRLFADGSRTACGPFVCISPWNFPLAIFTGQIVAALAAGNPVIAKPAEQTPLIAARAVALMHEAGIPGDVLALLPGDGPTVGGPLTSDTRTAGVCFTGSTQTAILIDRALAAGAGPQAPLIAETGGLNAMIVDSTALPEHAVRDIIASAFQSAGQRCSALRVLFVQSDIEEKLLEMLAGAVRELSIGDPWDAATDVGPVIDAEALETISGHCQAFAEKDRILFSHPMTGVSEDGRFIAPTIIRLADFAELEREIFGPILHVLDYEADELDAVVARINASGYGLTLGMHSRVDDRVDAVCRAAHVGNIYINRNQIGAVVGVQPFGGEGLSGTGPKAGGPHYLARFTGPADRRSHLPGVTLSGENRTGPAAQDPAAFAETALATQDAWDRDADRLSVLHAAIATLAGPARAVAEEALSAAAHLTASGHNFAGPTGESNQLSHHGRGIALCLGGNDDNAAAMLVQAVIALAAGNAVALPELAGRDVAGALVPALIDAGAPVGLVGVIADAGKPEIPKSLPGLGLVAYEGDDDAARRLRLALAERPGARIPLVTPDDIAMFSTERVISIDTTAAGGNATLLTLEDA